MLSEQQKAVLAELKKRQLSPKQSAIVAELERRDTASTDPNISDQDFSKLSYEQKMASIQNDPGVKQLPLGFTSEDKPFEVTGEKVAEKLGAAGYPIAGAAVGTGIQMAPDIAMATVPINKAKAVGSAVTPAIKKATDIAFAPTLKSAGKALGKAEEAAGITVEAINKNLPRTRNAIIDQLGKWEWIAKEPVSKVAELDPKTLNVVRKEAGDLLDFLNVATKNKSPKQLVTKREVALLAQIKDKVNKVLSGKVPSVGAKMKDYGNAAKRADLLRTAGKIGGLGAIGGGAVYGGNALVQALRNLGK